MFHSSVSCLELCMELHAYIVYQCGASNCHVYSPGWTPGMLTRHSLETIFGRYGTNRGSYQRTI